MSGFVGIVHLDGEPIDSRVLRKLTDFQAFRGPDGKRIWMDGCVGFGCTQLNTNENIGQECQPVSIDGRLWMVGDCRVDGRAALIAELENRVDHDICNASDAELILHAYHAWSEKCVEHVLGDFAFAIWDACYQRLFCARDQMGVKPFYYAQIGDLLIFSNTLNCIRQHPRVPHELNDLAVADFLLFDMIREPAGTSFKYIQRLPPAHFLRCEKNGSSVHRYWTLPQSAAIQYRDSNQYVEHFRELLDTAVADRLRTSKAGILMSGGLDSATMAASAQRIFAHEGKGGSLRAYTEALDGLIPDEERHYAGLVAKALNIPIEFHVNTEFGSWKRVHQQEFHWPEPLHSPWSDWGVEQLRTIAKTRRVVLTGQGGDPALSCLLSRHFLQLLEQRQFGRAITDMLRYLRAEGRFSRMYLRTRLRRWSSPKNGGYRYPEWLDRDFENRLKLRHRWEAENQCAEPVAAVRPVAYEAISNSLWPAVFESYDAGTTGVPVEVRHPFFDLRLVNFLLALPALPWCSDKELLREAARSVLPEAVRLRRKTPLRADPLVACLQQPESEWVDEFQSSVELEGYVQRKRIPKVFKETDSWKAWINLRPLSLQFWLHHRKASGINVTESLGTAS